MADDDQVFRAVGVDEELVFRTEDNEPLRAAVLSAFHGGSRPFIAPVRRGAGTASACTSNLRKPGAASRFYFSNEARNVR